MAVRAVVSVVIQKLTDLLNQESIIINKQIDEVEQIRITLRRMQSFLKDVEDQQKSNGTVEWVSKFLRTVYDVEDAVEMFVLRKTRLRRKRFDKFIFIIKELKASQTLRREMRKINNSINNLKEEWEPLSVRKSSDEDEDEDEGKSLHMQLISRHSGVEKSYVIGFKEEAMTLMTQLTDTATPNGKRLVVSIVGEGGSGKTTLATTIYNHREIEAHFTYRAWVSVYSKDVTSKSILLSILTQVPVLKEEEKYLSCDELTVRLFKHLKGERYLIVMDGTRTANVWQELQFAFPDTGNGSRVMFTTRNREVAVLADPSRRHQMKPLNDEDSLKLFLKKTGLTDNRIFSHSEMGNRNHLKEKIKTKCHGFPLAIVVLGELMKTRNVSDEVLLEALEDLSSQFDGKVGQLPNITALSNKDLPFHLRPCFLYFGLFPKDEKIPVRRLFRLWLAEGFVKQLPGMTPEDLVEKYLEDLVDRNMIQIVKRRSDGSPKTCCMLGFLYDIFLSKAKDIGLFHIHETSSECESTSARPPPPPPQFGVRRVVEHHDIKDYPHHDKELYIKHLRSYLSFNRQKGDTPAVETGKFLTRIIAYRGFGLLRVLDLEGIYKPHLPEEMGSLFHLRYLGLRWTFLENLPSSVGNLPYLETLDVKHTYISTLPTSIWKMKHLRHLCLNEISLDMSVRKSYRSSLTQLQTLSGLFVDKKSPVKNGLTRLINLRKLGLTCHSDCVPDLSEWIAKLASLQSLRLRSKDEMGQPSELNLKPLSCLERLSHLYLVGNLPKLPEFPPKLRVLTLSVSQLKEDPMPTLAQLPNLSVLRLLADSYIGNKMVCPRHGFGELRLLKLWMLKDLEEWTVEEGALLNLQELEIRCCHKLKKFPDSLLNMGTIEELIFTNMPEEFVESVEKTNKNKKNIHKRLSIKRENLKLEWKSNSSDKAAN